MAIYIGKGNKVKIIFNKGICKINIISKSSIDLETITLLSLDNYVLKDKNGLSLIVKEDE